MLLTYASVYYDDKMFANIPTSHLLLINVSKNDYSGNYEGASSIIRCSWLCVNIIITLCKFSVTYVSILTEEDSLVLWTDSAVSQAVSR